jgi:AcrR family transcriptional regulator
MASRTTKDTRRGSILCAAHRLFGRYGPGKTTIADIAREANISVGAVYLDFPSKESVLEALAEKEHLALLEVMQNAARDAEDMADALRRAVVARTRHLCTLANATHGCDLIVGCQPVIRGVRDRYAARELALFAQILSDGKKRGETSVEPKETARALADAFATLLPPFLEPSEKAALKRAHALVDLVAYGVTR